MYSSTRQTKKICVLKVTTSSISGIWPQYCAEVYIATLTHPVFKYVFIANYSPCVDMGGQGAGCSSDLQSKLRFYVQGAITKRCRLSWLTNSALVYEPKCGGGWGCGFSANEYCCAHRARTNFRYLTPYLTITYVYVCPWIQHLQNWSPQENSLHHGMGSFTR
jgi:hypothetical protein